MKTTPRSLEPTCRHRSGFMLVEVLVYVAVLFMILGLASAAFLRTLDQVRTLRRTAEDVTRALYAGERWRAELRATTAAPRLVIDDHLPSLHLPMGDGEVVYRFDGRQVLRAAGPDRRWLPVLPGVKESRFIEERRERVVSWRWELELEARRLDRRPSTRFTFQAVPTGGSKP